MGAYLSKPVTDTISSDETSDKLSYGASSMQGWRISQEDAHSAILDYDTNTSFFAVFDGHGGAEVAQYSAQHLPSFLKNSPFYRSGDITKALEEGFLDFDTTLVRPDVVVVLKALAGVNDSDNEEDANEASLLREEANMPIEQLLARYNGAAPPEVKEEVQDENAAGCSSKPKSSLPFHMRFNKEPNPVSPYLRAKQSKREDLDEIGHITGMHKPESSCQQSNSNDISNGEIKEQPDSTNSDLSSELHKENSEENHSNGEITSSNDAKEVTKSESQNEDPKEVRDNPESQNEEPTSSSMDYENLISTSEAATKTPSGSKGKGKQKKLIVPKPNRGFISETAEFEVPAYEDFLRDFRDSEESDDDDERQDFADQLNSSDDEDEEKEDSDSSEESEESDDEDDEDDEEENDVFEAKEEVGKDSGCTAVVALVKDLELYVANAGDSRCIVSRNGTAIEMSFDHKPEDEIERQRVEKAGGKVTADGRVNGGLNLSRAFGDHAYKENKDLPSREQMITALPDIKTLTLKPDEDEFLVLACDGIWNSMTSQQVVDFVRPRLNTTAKLSEICEELFNLCLAPNTMGDGTGCDNMTCIIVKLNNLSAKRKSSDDTFEEPLAAKKSKTEEIDVQPSTSR